MKLKEWIDENCVPGELCAPEMEIADAMAILKDEILGEDFYIPYSCNGKQAVAEIVSSVVKRVKGVDG